MNRKPLLLYVGTGAFVTPRGSFEDDFFVSKGMVHYALSVFHSIARIGVVLLPSNRREVLGYGMPSCILLDQPVLRDSREMIRRFSEWGIDAPVVCLLSTHEEVKLARAHVEAEERAGRSLPFVSPVCTGEYQRLWVGAFLHHAA